LAEQDVEALLWMNACPDETTLLKIAVGQGLLSVVEYWLEQGADPSNNGRQ
jgi:hypothetical protein